MFEKHSLSRTPALAHASLGGSFRQPALRRFLHVKRCPVAVGAQSGQPPSYGPSSPPPSRPPASPPPLNPLAQNGSAAVQPPQPYQQPYPPQPYPQQPYPQQPYQQQSYQQPYASPPPTAAPGYTGSQAVPYQAGSYGLRVVGPPQSAAPPQGSGALGDLERVNPGKNSVNSVTLMGTVFQPRLQSRVAVATLQVPYATKPGHQEFELQAWDALGTQMTALHGAQVVIQGRLDRDRNSGAVVVVARRIQVVDPTLSPSQVEPRAGASTGGGAEAAKRSRLSALGGRQELWRTHYETTTQTTQALAAMLGVQPKTVLEELLSHAFETGSPLRWRTLALEQGLGVSRDGDALTLDDFMLVVGNYKAEMAGLQEGAQPGAAPVQLPTTKDGRLRVRPIREWALSKDEADSNYYIISEYLKQQGESKLYTVLQMAVVAEATAGVWDYGAEFPESKS